MCWVNTLLDNRKTVQRTDLSKALAFNQRFDFCVDLIPEFAFERNSLISTSFPYSQFPYYEFNYENSRSQRKENIYMTSTIDSKNHNQSTGKSSLSLMKKGRKNKKVRTKKMSIRKGRINDKRKK